MTTHPIYDLLMHDVTEPLERSVLNVLIEHAGQKVSRPDLVFKVFGHYVQSKELANNQDDRKIRECIERLQQKSFPILASSGSAGYVLADSDAELDSYLAEIESRRNTLLEKEKALRSSRRWIRSIQEYKAHGPMKQGSMFAKPTVMP